MRILIMTILATCVRLFAISCECEHVYDADVMAIIDAEGDTCSDDHLYQMDNLHTHMQYWPDSNKLLKQAAYAFDTFRYNKCLEKIKEYERAAFPPPYDYPSPKEELTILAYKAYSNRFLKKYDVAIHYFEKMIEILKRNDCLAPECKFITYFEHAQCYLLKGDKREFRNRIKRIVELDIAPKYDYYVKRNFRIHHQPCFHDHHLKEQERMVFKAIAPIALGQELYALLEERGETPKIKTVSNNKESSEFCRRMCARASYLSAIIVGCITRKTEAMAAAAALGELLVDCDVCCREGWGSKNCCRDIKWAFEQVCQQHLLDGL